MKPLPLGKPDIPPGAWRSIREVLESGMLVEGERCRNFAGKLAGYLGSPHVILVNSGTSALYLSLVASGIGPGDAVLVPAYSFPATANVVAWTGALPIFTDIHPGTWNMDADSIQTRLASLPASLAKRIKAVMPVQSFGNPLAMGPLLALARKRGWIVIEDAACALGSTLDGRACGTHAALGCFSFHPRKILTTSEGGAIAVRSSALAKKLSLLKNHGMMKKGPVADFPGIGMNMRFTEVAAALGAAQLDRMDAMVKARRRHAEAYRRGLAGLGLGLQQQVPGATANWQSLVTRLPVRNAAGRDRAIASLGQQGIGATIGTYFLPSLPAFRGLEGNRKGAFPFAEAVFRESVSLPLFTGLGAGGIARVIAALSRVLG